MITNAFIFTLSGTSERSGDLLSSIGRYCLKAASVAGTNRGSESQKSVLRRRREVVRPVVGPGAIRRSLLPSATSVGSGQSWAVRSGSLISTRYSIETARLLPIPFSYSIKTRLAVAGAGTFLPVNVAPSVSPLSRRSPKRGL